CCRCRRADGQDLSRVGVAEKVYGTIEDGLDDVSTAGGAGGKEVTGARGTVENVDGDRTTNDGSAAQNDERLRTLVDRTCCAGNPGAQRDGLPYGGAKGCGGAGGGRCRCR